MRFSSWSSDVVSSDLRYIDVWGSGRPMREFLHVDDLADACVRLMTHYSGEGVVNVGAGYDLTIMELAEMICEVVGFNGAIRFDSTKPDGTPRKLDRKSVVEGKSVSVRVNLGGG